MLMLVTYFVIIIVMVGDLGMGFQDVAFLPSQDRFSTTFLKNCGTGESLAIIICPKTVVGGKQASQLCIKYIC